MYETLKYLLLNSQYYATELKEKITSELEASFFEGLEMFEAQDIHRLPATLLSEVAVKHYCLTYIEQLHGMSQYLRFLSTNYENWTVLRMWTKMQN